MSDAVEPPAQANDSSVMASDAADGVLHDGCCHIFECQWTVPTAVTVQNAAGSKPESGGKSESSHVSLVASIGAAETFSPVRHGYLWSRGSPGAGTAVFRIVPRRLL